MKKQLLFMTFIASVAVNFIACSSSDEAIAENGKALSLDASILRSAPMEISTRSIVISSDTVWAGVMHTKEVEVSTSEISRAPLDDTPTWSGSEAVTVKVDGRYFQYAIGGSGSSSTMTSASPYYFTTTSNLTANVWFPSSGAANKTTHEVLANQSTDANFKNSDFMYGSGTVSHANANSISMAHKIAKVRVTVNVVNPSYLNNSTVNSVVLSGTKRSSSVGSNGALTASGDASDITMHPQSPGVFEACIIPQTATLTFKVNVGGTTYTSTVVASRAYAANNIYTATIKITASNVLYLGGSSVAIGDYYCRAANGQAFVVKKANITSAINKGIIPIAIVFSNTTCEDDRTNGWNLGYAMSLKEANMAMWSNDVTTLQQMVQYPNVSNISTCISDYRGYTFTHYIVSRSNKTKNPAFFEAINFSNTVPVPRTSSGWFLGSVGQWYLIFTNLGGASGATDNDGSDTEMKWTNVKATTVWNNLNGCLNNVSGYRDLFYRVGGDTHYLTSCECNVNALVDVCFGSTNLGDKLFFYNRYSSSKLSYLYLRPCIAF